MHNDNELPNPLEKNEVLSRETASGQDSEPDLISNNAEQETSRESMFQQRMIEATSLSSEIPNIAANTEISMEDMLKEYFSQRESVFGQNAETLSRNVLAIENWLSQIEASDEQIQSIRTAILRTVLSGHLSAEDIISRVNGGISVKGLHENQNIAAMFKISEGKTSISLHEPFFSESQEAQINHFQHEIGHILTETGSIWDKDTYETFLDAVSTLDDTKIATIESKNPELAYVYNLIKNPDQSYFFRGYIQRKLQEVQNSDNQTQARIKAAKEVIAELVSNFTQSDGSELSFFNARLEHCDIDLSQLCLKVSGLETMDEFMEKYGGDRDELSPQVILSILHENNFFSGDLDMQRAITEKFSNVFNDNGSGLLQPERQRDLVILDEPLDFGENPMRPISSDPKTNIAKQATDPFDWFYDFLTGRSSKS